MSGSRADGTAGRAGELLDLAERLVAVPSVSRSEAAICDLVEAHLRALPGLEVVRVGDNLVARTTGDRPRRVLLGGHLDTVPPAGHPEPARSGDRLSGLGATDMKGGLAVLLGVAASAGSLAVETTFVFYACEEVAAAENGLRRLFATHRELLEADVAVLAEPTSATVEAGCQGTARVRISMAGVRAHTARPWAGVNAIHRLAPVLEQLERYQGREPVLEGCRYAEQLQAVAVSGGVAGNVVPDAAEVLVNHRFAPDLTAAEAVERLATFFAPLLGPDDRFEVLEAQGGAPPSLRDPVLAALVAGSGRPAVAKVGWTDVATCWEQGMPAANFGPGDPLLAHTAGEFVDGRELAAVEAVLLGALGAG